MLRLPAGGTVPAELYDEDDDIALDDFEEISEVTVPAVFVARLPCEERDCCLKISSLT